jgi:octaprenyl-diphosphate synthase
MTEIASNPSVRPASDFASIQRLCAADMAEVDAAIRSELNSDVLLINQIGEHIVRAGGKRLRPLLVVLCARACGATDLSDATRLAAVIEFIHTATLLHDDVVDESGLRRGRQTANALWGNAASVLVGDFLYSRAFQMMVAVDRMAVMRLLADTTNAIAAGEVLQLLEMGNPDLSESKYLEVIRRKTAILFAAACRLGALCAGADEAQQRSLYDYGMALGIAFQIADDVLDYAGAVDTIGKNVGDDLAEGKTTLPLILAQSRGSEAEVAAIREAIANADRQALPAVLAAIRNTDALDASLARASQFASDAISSLPALTPSAHADALRALARFAVQRVQ